MKKSKISIFSSFVMALLLIIGSEGSSAQAGEGGNRTSKRFGIHLGLLGDPFPTALGFNVNYNLASFLRVGAGYGSISSTSTTGLTQDTLKFTTRGANVRGMVPGWNFTPVVTLGYAQYSKSGTGVLGGFSESGSHLYYGLGLDWQTAIGFNFGAGFNNSLKTGITGVPYINFGWYF